jgi:hypothetical protein
MTTDKWAAKIDRVAVYLYRDEHDWHPEAVWSELDDTARSTYRKRADAVAAMLGFPYDAKVVAQFDLLCPCDPNPETTEGPLRECPIHGQWPDSVVAIAQAVRIADAAEKLFPTHDGKGSLGRHWEYVDHTALDGLRAALRLRAPRCEIVIDPTTAPCGLPATARWTDGATDEQHYTCAAHEHLAEGHYERREVIGS